MTQPSRMGKSSESKVPATLEQLRQIEDPIEKYLFLRDLRSNEHDVFYTLLSENMTEVLAYVYTPWVGTACQRYFDLPLRPWGLFISYTDKGSILSKLQSWPQQAVNVIVVTDGEHILGLGDLGAGGQGICEGKIELYTAAAGVDPANCLPICLDVGTNNEELLANPKYQGLRQKRVSTEQYEEFVHEFVQAVKEWQPNVVLQFEDFANDNAFMLLEKYRSELCCFNDDIQGTACVCLAGLLNAVRVTKIPLQHQRVLFFGAGKAAVGIAELISLAMCRFCDRLSPEEARRHCIMMDSKGLVCAERTDLAPHKQEFAHDIPHAPDLVTAIQTTKPTVLVGVSTQANTFTREVIEAMCSLNAQPLIFPLSNPTSKSECTFEQAYEWGKGNVLFASGSPFPPMEIDGRKFTPSQANNAYVFPAVGHAAVLANASHLPDDVFLQAASALSEVVSDEELKHAALFPSFEHILDVNKRIMARLGAFMVENKLGRLPEGVASWDEAVDRAIWRPGKDQASASKGKQ